MPHDAATESEFFAMHRASTASFVDPKLCEPRFYSRRTTPQKVGETLR